MDFDEGEAVKVVDAAAECFRAARTLASDLLRRGDLVAKEMAASGAATTTVAAVNPAAGGGAGGVVSGAWAVDRLELLAMAKLAVSNGVAAMQVIKHASSFSTAAAATAAAAKGGARVAGRAELDFSSHSQFPVVKPTFTTAVT